VVERHVANVAVVGSSPITRFIVGREGRENEDLRGLRVRALLGFLNFWEHFMTDEKQPQEQEPDAAATVAEQSSQASAAESHKSGEGSRPLHEEEEASPIIAEETLEAAADEPQKGEEEPTKLKQTVDMRDIGPCKKHIKVTIDRDDIDRLLNKKYSKLVTDAHVPGFRPGKAPRKMIERRFRKDVTNEVRGELLMQSLEQLADEQDVAPLSSPNIDPTKIEIPEKGPLVYEFEVEVRPQFDLPNYKGLHLKKPVRTFSEADVEQEERRILAPYGSLVPKEEGDAQIGDYLIADMTTRLGDRLLSTHKEITIRIDPRLALKDGVADRFGERVKGAKAGDTRKFDIRLLDGVADATLRGQTVEATLEIKDVKKQRLPELTTEFLHQFGVHTAEQLRERIRVLLKRRLEYAQRQAARQQVLGQITAASAWELPQELLQRQARSAMNRRAMEMQSAGMPEEEIRGRLRLLQQDVLRTTELELKEHFVLQKIAEVEKLDIDEDDLDDEIERMAVQNDESPRRVRARLEKEDLMEALATEIIERKALDLILNSAEYEEVPMDREEGPVGTVEEQAVPGKMQDPTAEPAKEKEEEKEESPKGEKPPETES
jgi:trigger factor